jgi:hypothetical protein
MDWFNEGPFEVPLPAGSLLWYGVNDEDKAYTKEDPPMDAPLAFRVCCAAAFDGGDHGSDLRLEISGRCEKGEAEERR